MTDNNDNDDEGQTSGLAIANIASGGHTVVLGASAENRKNIRVQLRTLLLKHWDLAHSLAHVSY